MRAMKRDTTLMKALRYAGRSRSLSAGLAATTAALVLLAGCAAYGPGALRLGDAEAAVVASMGRPSARHALPDGGTRLVYARGPEGRHTWMVDLGADGRVQRWHQALGEEAFARIAPGMAADDLLRDYGPPAHRLGIARRGTEVWSWRYPTYECRWFRVTLDERGRVLETSYGPDPVCVIEEESGL